MLAVLLPFAMWRALAVCVLATAGCVDHAYAQSVSRSDAGDARAPRFRVTAPRETATTRRRAAVREVQRTTSVLTALLGTRSDAGSYLASAFVSVRSPSGVGLSHDDGLAVGALVDRSGLARSPASADAGALSSAGRASGSRVLRDDVMVRGSRLLNEVVSVVMSGHRERFSTCFERPTVATPPVHATVIARFEVVRQTGGPPRITVQSVEGAEASICACVRAQIEGLQFADPPDAAPIVVRYTLSL